MATAVRSAYELVRDAAIDWWEDRAMRLGAAIAYYAIFSLGPVLLLVIVIAGVVFGREAAQEEMVGTLGRYVGDDGARVIEDAIASASGSSGGLVATAVGVGGLLFGATALFGQLEDALNTVWEVTPKASGIRGALRSRLVGIVAVLGGGLVLVASLFGTAVLATIGKAFPDLALLIQGGQALLSFALVTACFALLYKVLPAVKIRWRDVWIGALVAALLFTLGQFLLGLYIRKAHVGSSYGAAGSLIVVLVWVYYTAQILFFGAEITQVYACRYGSLCDRKPEQDELSEADS